MLEYRRQRQEEGKRKLNLDGEQVFHDGHDVLDLVKETHEHIKKKARAIDFVTVEILPVLDDMLLNEEEPRLGAKHVLHKSRRIVKAVREKFGILPLEDAPKSGNDNVNVKDEEQPSMPPSLPPGFAPSLRSINGSRVGTFASGRPLSMSSVNSLSPTMQSATSRMYHSKVRAMGNEDENITNQYGPFQSDSYGVHDLPDPPSPASSYQSSNLDKFSALSVNTQDLDQVRGNRRAHRETMGQPPKKVNSMTVDTTNIRRSQTEKRPSNPIGHPSAESVQNSSGEPLHLSQRQSSTGNQFSHPPESEITATYPEKNTQQIQEPQRPHLSLEQGLEWKRKKKQGYQALLKGEENLTYVNERDHVRIPLLLLSQGDNLTFPDLPCGQYSIYEGSPK